MVRTLLKGLLQGSWIGLLILGLGGRVLMRVIALAGGLPGGFSWGGSLEVLLLGLLLGASGGPVIALLQTRLRVAPYILGTAAGLLYYVLVLILPISGKEAASGFPQLAWLVHLGFCGLFLAYGLVLVKILRSQET